MKRLILTITIVLVLIGISADVVNAQINWQYIAQSERIRNTSYGRFPRMGGSMGGSQVNWRYIAQSERIRNTSYGRFPRMGGSMGGSQVNWRYIAQSEMIRNTSYGRLPYIGGYGANVRIRHNESWNSRGGQRSYEQSPDYLGQVIDSATTLGALAILSH